MSSSDVALMFVAGTLTGIGVTLLAMRASDVVTALRSISGRLSRGQRRRRLDDNPFGP